MPLKGTYNLPWTPDAGDFAPFWNAPAENGRAYTSDSAPGRAQLLCFVSGNDDKATRSLLEDLGVRSWTVEGLGCTMYAFVSPQSEVHVPLPFPLLHDENSSIARAFCLPLAQRASEQPSPRAVLVNSDGRILAAMPLGQSPNSVETALSLVRRHSPFTNALALHPPILHLPQLFSQEMCRTLVEAWHSGHAVEGTMLRMRDGRAVRVVDTEYKNRRDFRVNPPLRDTVWKQLLWRMVPAVRKAFRFDISHFEYLQVGCYSAEEKGHFSPHRDDGNAGNVHRRFALTLNLNSGYDGGKLYFPEYGTDYKLSTGDGIVFSCSMLHEATPVTRGERFVLVGMFWGEAEEAQWERSRALRVNAAKPAVSPQVTRGRQIGDSARMLREIAGDLNALGSYLDGRDAAPKRIGERVNMLRRRLTRLRDDLKALREPYLKAQVGQLDLAAPADLRLHIGCGPHRLPGWVNIDVNGGDLRMDLRWPLPFPDGSVRYVFASHVIEHVYRHGELPALLREIHRVLQPGGVLRAVVPDIEKCIRAYAANDAQFFAERSKTWAWAANCKTPLDHFLGYAGANQPLEKFGGHKYGYDLPTLTLALNEAGFSRVERSEFMTSAHDELRIDVHSHNALANVNGEYYSLFVEATK